jgi:hypothetical protein
MNPDDHNLTDIIARQLIDERVQTAQRRATARALRREKRDARREALRTAPARSYDLPASAFRFLHPVR